MVDALIRLFDASATSFTTNGLGSLSEAISCEVTEGLNLSENGFELSMTYPITGRLFKDISLRKIIVAKSNPFSDPQAFRIYYISKPINGIISIDAAHISYDLTGYPVSPFESEDAWNAFIDLKNASVLPCPFNFSTDKTTVAHLNIKKPMSMKMALGGTEGSILDIYRGEYEFNNFNVKLWNHRGSNNGVSIRYGKNLIDLEQEENCESVKTGIYPYWYSEETEELVELPEKIVNAPGTYSFQSIESYDMTDRFEEKPTIEQLRSAAQNYVNNNNIGIPKVSLTVSFVSLSQSEEYKSYALIQNVKLGDTVNVFFEKLGVNSTAKCIKTDYDVLTNKYIKIHLGDASKGIVDTIAEQMNDISEQNKKIDAKPSMTVIEEAIDKATKSITGGLGGYVVIRSSTGGEHPDEILIMDHDNIEDSIKIWRWNRNGLGYSSQGYNGPFEVAMTSDGSIVANFITSGVLRAIEINSCYVNASHINGSEITIKDNNGNVLFYGGDGKSEISGWSVSPTKIEKTVGDYNVVIQSGGAENDVAFGIIKNGEYVYYVNNNADGFFGGEINSPFVKGDQTKSSVSSVGALIGNGEIEWYGQPYGSMIGNTFNSTVTAVYSLADNHTINVTFTVDTYWYSDLYWTSSSGLMFSIYVLSEYHGNVVRQTITEHAPSNMESGGWIPTGANRYWHKTVSINYQGDILGISDRISDIVGAERVVKTYSMQGNTRMVEIPCTRIGTSLVPDIASSYDIGSANAPLRTVFCQTVSHSSTRDIKKDISDFDERHDVLFDKLRPRTFKYKNNDSERTHYGFIVDEVVDAITKAGMTTQDCAAVVLANPTDASKNGGLRYEEFIPLLVEQVHLLKARVDELERR